MIRAALVNQVNRELKAFDAEAVHPEKGQLVCEAWPAAEATLTAMSQMIKTGWLIRLLFTLVLIAGRALASRFCKGD